MEHHDIEKSIISVILNYPNKFFEISDFLFANHFEDEINKTIYQEIRNIIGLGGEPDIVKLSYKLKKIKNIKSILAEILVYNNSITCDLKYMSALLIQEDKKRNLNQLSFDIRNRLEDDQDILELISYVSAKVDNISDIGSSESKNLNTQLDDMIQDVEQRIGKGGITGIPSGFEKVDNFTGGWQPTDLIIIGGTSSMGKTSLALNFVYNAAKLNKIPCVMFSYEMSSNQLLMRLISMETGINTKWMMQGALNKKDLKTVKECADDIKGLPIIIDECKRTSLEYLISKIRKHYLSNNIKIIIVDYLQLVSTKVGKGTREQEVSKITRALKNIAKELNITIIALSQLNRGVSHRENNTPTLSDLRESGEIEQASDVVILIYRPEYYGISKDQDGNDVKGIAEIIFAKGRNIGVGKIKLKFIQDLTKFENYENDF
jgi:replicative DNA helicase